MKPLTFEEWEELTAETTVGQGKYWRVIFDAARQGMIPEDEAVRIPPVSGWPESNSPSFTTSRGLAVYAFQTWHDREEQAKDIMTEDDVRLRLIAYIPRPAPAWTPKVGDAVFAHENDGIVAIGLWVSGDSKRCMVKICGRDILHLSYLVKPFDPSKIGKPWEEI